VEKAHEITPGWLLGASSCRVSEQHTSRLAVS
jgi:hypothetical protein